MSETGFRCPECGYEDGFTANCYYVFNAELSISADGWEDTGKYGDMELPEHADLTCGRCGHEDNWHMFEEGYGDGKC